MILLTVDNLFKEYDGKKVTQPISFSIKDHDKIALLGTNGCGKTTLLKILTNQIEKSWGNFSYSSNITFGYLSQDIIKNLSNTLYEEMLEVFSNLIELKKELQILSEKISNLQNSDELMNKYSQKETYFLNNGGYNFEYQIDTVLTMFNFTKQDYSKKIGDFSGGERSKIAFAKLLLMKPDLLFLDEPTNHLDVMTIEWLEIFLQQYSGAILFVTHDVSFIKNIANKVFEISNSELEIYNGNYEYYCNEKKLRYEQKLALYNTQQKLREKYIKFIEFYMPKPRFVSRAHDREKKLEKLEKNMIKKPVQEKNKVHIDLKGVIRKGKTLIKFENVSIGYDSNVLIEDINFTLYGQDHLVVMGDNGSGKTTFIKTILSKIPSLKGEIIFKDNFSLGYLEQDFRNLDVSCTIFEYIKKKFPSVLDQNLYNHLGKFKFNYEDSNTKMVNSLSGGEMMRLQICVLALSNFDILLLDEPTNHLDIFSKEELVDALNDYQGSLIVISHDRDFIDKISNKILYFYNKNAYFFEGAYQEFKNDVLNDLLQKKKDAEKRKKLEEKPSNKPQEKKNKISIFKYEKILNSIEKLEAKNIELNKLAFSEEYYSNPEKMKNLNLEIKSNQDLIDSYYLQLEEMEK